MLKKLEMKELDLKRAESRANTVQNHLDTLNDKLKSADKKVTRSLLDLGLRYN